MKLLIVEDQPDFMLGLRRAIDDLQLNIEVIEATSRDGARRALEANELDYILCDLVIPSEDDLKDEELAYGLAVYSAAREFQEGVPVQFLTAFGTVAIDEITRILNRADRFDLFGRHEPFGMASYKNKRELIECVQEIGDFARELETLDGIEITIRDSGDFQLDPMQSRALRIFGRRNAAGLIRASTVGEGLSSASTIRAVILNTSGQPVVPVIAKLDTIAAVRREQQNFQNRINLLEPGAFAQYLDIVEAGASGSGGIFYRLADSFGSTLFEYLGANLEAATDVIGRLQALEKTWRQAARTEQLAVQRIRRMVLSDDDMTKFNIAADERCEATSVQAHVLIQHGDLHGANVLVDNSGRPILIDYGDVDVAVGSRDPVTLELSAFFHPSGLFRDMDWPTLEQARRWADVDSYLEGCPNPDFVRACRKWCAEDSDSNKAVDANVYAYALRQLKYDGTNHDLAEAFARGAAERILSR